MLRACIDCHTFSFIVDAHDAKNADTAPSGKSVVGSSMLGLKSTSMISASLITASFCEKKKIGYRLFYYSFDEMRHGAKYNKIRAHLRLILLLFLF